LGLNFVGFGTGGEQTGGKFLKKSPVQGKNNLRIPEKTI
jgi:hypothetical protein